MEKEPPQLEPHFESDEPHQLDEALEPEGEENISDEDVSGDITHFIQQHVEISSGPSAILDFSETPYTGMVGEKGLVEAFERRQRLQEFVPNKSFGQQNISSRAIAIGQRLYEGAETQRENKK